MNNEKIYYLGLDIGTDSVGYAVTDKKYNLLKFHGKQAWGVTLFDEASLQTDRRAFRTSRRRLDRRQQRVKLIQELFAKEIAKTDPRFFIRQQESFLFRKETDDEYILFNDADFSDKDYYKLYPTIHHLINDLSKNAEPHDVRLVYLACSWLVAHRGHFLNNMDKANISAITDFSTVYSSFISFFTERDEPYDVPWESDKVDELGKILKKKAGVNYKSKELIALLYGGNKPSKIAKEEFPFSQDAIVKLLAGGTCKVKDLFCNEEYEEFGTVSLGMGDEKFEQLMADIGDDYELVKALRLVFDWSVLSDILGNSSTISESKVAAYEQHKKDLEFLKRIICKYKSDRYDEVFRDIGKNNYPAYSYHSDETEKNKLKKTNKEDFSKFILGIVKDIAPDETDIKDYDDMIKRLEFRTFMPKQKDTDNRVIPHQLYWYELDCILKNAEKYLPFLSEKDGDGITVSQKIESVFLFRIPYFVGPLNSHSERSWFKRKAEGKIYPWNFDKLVDLDESEEQFIKRMTNTCTYLPGEAVLPKDSILYQKFTVLNEINNIRINGERISVELKQRIFNELFANKKKVTKKAIEDFLICNGELAKDEKELLTGIDININSKLTSYIAFRKMLSDGILTEADAERIIERASYAEDKSRLSKWIASNYPNISYEDRNYICRLKIKDFGRLSRKLLCEIYSVSEETGEAVSIIDALWNTQNNLMELLSERFEYAKAIDEFKKEYYCANKPTLEKRLDEMYVSNAVKRPVYRTLAIVNDVVKAFGVPEKIFVEMTRGADESQKGKRTKTRKQQILELYEQCRDEDVKLLRQQLEAMGEYADNKLQGDKLFLYYMQLGKSMYSGTPIDIDKLGTKEYDIDHIYPQAFVKDDSIINNKVLVLSAENGAKSDIYPISDDIRNKMHSTWEFYRSHGLISEEKFKRLTRSTPFTDDEKYNFINRQLTQTSQSTKAVATLLKERFPDAEIVYCKAKLASEFRQEFGLYKSRTFNDLHHAVDAYLNIVTGNVYNMKFTRKWFSVNSKYSIKTKTIFTNPLICNGETVWDGEEMLAKVKETAVKNTAHFTKFAYFKHGGLFDQQLVPAVEGLTPIKKGMPTEKYGGYNKAGAMFYIPVRYKLGRKNEIIIMSVEMLYGKKFLESESFAKEYSFIRLKHILGKNVEEVSFPMGMRPWKVNTMLSLDGFRVCIAGIGSGGKCLVAQPVMQFSESSFWQFYLKKIESFVKKISDNPNYIYDKIFDEVSSENNIKLYDIYLNKLENSIYRKRVNNPIAILKKGKDRFIMLDIKEQSKALLNIQQIFGRIAGGCDLSLIGGASKAAATVSFSATVSNWCKTYSDIRIIDSSASGLWEKESQNLLNLL